MFCSKQTGFQFNLEEFVRSLQDLRIIEKHEQYRLVRRVQDLAIPSSIQDVIMARIDALAEGAREVIQTGSVIEREFSLKLIQAVLGLDDPVLLSNLSILKDAELLYERGVFPNTTYIFKQFSCNITDNTTAACF